MRTTALLLVSLLPAVQAFSTVPCTAECPSPQPVTVFGSGFNGCGKDYMPSTYSQYIEVFNAVTAHTLATAGECMVKDDWQTLSPRQKEEGVVCFTGPFDGHFALGHELPDGQMVMRIITNSEIRPRSSSGFTGSNSPGFYVSTNPATGGFGQPEPAEKEKFALYGATLMYLDVNRTTLEVLDIGQAIKHVFTPKKELHNTLIPADASSADVYAILDDYATLNNNIRADQPTPREVSLSDCEAFPEWCGLYAHCGSSYSMKHGHSYASPTTGGVKVDGVGFEDNVAFIAHEGSQGEGGIAGTVQVLDVDTGDQYQLPQLSIGEIEIAFAISTGESEHVAVVIMDYGAEGFPEGNVSPISYPTGRSSSYGSRVTLWIGKKDKTSAHFLDRNGLGLNQGRVYVFVADSGVTDTATMLNWPNSSRDCNLFTPTPGRFEPLPTVFDGRFYVDAAPVWTYDVINSLNTLYGNEPVRMTGVASQEWGSRSPSNPGAFAISHTTLSATLNPLPADMDDSRGTVSFYSTQIAAAVASATGAVTARDGSVLPDAITATVDAVMQDEFTWPEREARGVPKGLFKPDGLLYLADGTVISQEDQSTDPVYGFAVHYDPATCTGKPVAAALQRDNNRMTFLGTPPLGAHTENDANELTGAYDVSAALAVGPGYTAEDEFNAFTSKTISVNTQIWNAGNAQPGNCLTDYSLGWGGQMNVITIP